VTFILASASESRARILRAAGVPFEIQPAHVDEESTKEALLAEGADHSAVAHALAELKAVRVSTTHPGALVLGADQVGSFEGSLLSKCDSMDEAADLLRRMRGKTHELISALVLAKNGAAVWRHTSRARLTMRKFSDAFLADYLAREGKVLLKGVGCYRVEGPGAQLFEKIDGDYFSIQGLSLVPLLAVLRTQGVIAT
jgi:septum formation protein